VTPLMWHRSFAPGQVGRQWRGSTRVLAPAEVAFADGVTAFGAAVSGVA